MLKKDNFILWGFQLRVFISLTGSAVLRDVLDSDFEVESAISLQNIS